MSEMTDARALALIAELMTSNNQHTHHAAYSHIAARLRGESMPDAEIDARLNALHRGMRERGEHNGGMSGVAWDRAVYRAALSDAAAAPALSRVDPAVTAQLAKDVAKRQASAAELDALCTPAPVAGDAVARLPDELMDASAVEDGDGNLGASIAFADAAGRLRTALAQDRASQEVSNG